MFFTLDLQGVCLAESKETVDIPGPKAAEYARLKRTVGDQLRGSWGEFYTALIGNPGISPRNSGVEAVGSPTAPLLLAVLHLR